MTAASDYVDTKEVAAMLGVTDRTVRRLVERGELPEPIRVTRKIVRWKRRDVDRYLKKLGGQ